MDLRTESIMMWKATNHYHGNYLSTGLKLDRLNIDVVPAQHQT